MQCPACEKPLQTVKAGSVEVDVCKDFCGGIWFDSKEFEHFDEATESAPLEILKALSNAKVVIDRNKSRACPRCSGQKLEKTFFDSTHELEIDQCPSCSGIWLDPGELKAIRSDNKGATERQAVVDKFYNSASSSASSAGKRGLKAVLGLLFR